MRSLMIAAALLAAFAAGPASATLLGQGVTGTVSFGGPGGTNYFDPANGYVPSGYGNTASPTVTIADPQVEFGFDDGSNTDTADFNGSTLTITDVVSGSGASPFYMTFTSMTPGVFTYLATVSDGFGGTASLSGDTITYASPGTGTPGTYVAVLNLLAVPEPAALALLAPGLLGLAAVRRRAF